MNPHFKGVQRSLLTIIAHTWRGAWGRGWLFLSNHALLVSTEYPNTELQETQDGSSAGGSEQFKDKEKFFFAELSNHHSKHHRGEINLRVDRYNLLNSVSTMLFYVSIKYCRKFLYTLCMQCGFVCVFAGHAGD